MQRVIDTVAKVRPGVVFLAWGSPAAMRVKDVNKDKHLILKSVHPSPLSASRGWVSQEAIHCALCSKLTWISSTVITLSRRMTGSCRSTERGLRLIGT
jgi:uracil DNA glycosylase